jgi:hypothetical protein
MMRTLVAAIALAVPGLAHADSGMLPGGATITFNRLFLHESSCTGYCNDGECVNGSGMCGGSQAQAQEKMDPQSLWFTFNLAHCQCSQQDAATITPFYENTFAYEILLNNQTTPIHAPLEIWVGQTCDDMISRQMNCHQIMDAGIADIASIKTTNGIAPEIPIFDLMEPATALNGCEQRVLTTAEWAISNVNPDGTVGGTPQYFVSKSISTDSLPPPLPTVFHVSGAESAIQISWDPPIGDIADVAYYQALCAIAPDGVPALTKPPAPKYQTAFMLCGATSATTPQRANLDCPTTGTTALLPAVDAAVDADIDAPPDAPPDAPVDAGSNPNCPDTVSISDFQGLAQLDPTFICGEVDDATATSMRIQGLQDGQSYAVVFVAIDKFGNPASVYFPFLMQPKPVTDFWQDLHNRGSQVEGGFCLIAETFGDDNPLTQALRGFRDDNLASTVLGRALIKAYYATLGKLGALVHGHVVLRVISGVLLAPLVAIALAWHWLTLPGLLLLVLLGLAARRWRFRLPRYATVAALAFLPTLAHAQTPYWDDKTSNVSETTPPAETTDDVSWHAGIRVGPYTPGIDKQFGMDPGPYAEMFGTSPSILPMFDFDRVLWKGFGQVTVGLSLGYMSRDAHAWAICMPGDVTCNDTPGDPNRTRSQGDTNSFHLLPIQVTAAYRFTTLDDEYGIPVVPYARGGLAYYIWWINGPSGNISTAAGTSAKGASAGLVGSVGLAIRAERIDADAARSMRDSGIEHAGFYAELQTAWVDGFGKSTKLSVGDNTWFAGVDFEF